jgi:hypothetical protein
MTLGFLLLFQRTIENNSRFEEETKVLNSLVTSMSLAQRRWKYEMG